jgi:hypothetical protein
LPVRPPPPRPRIRADRRLTDPEASVRLLSRLRPGSTAPPTGKAVSPARLSRPWFTCRPWEWLAASRLVFGVTAYPCAGVPRPGLTRTPAASGRVPPRTPGRPPSSSLRPRARSGILSRSLAPVPCRAFTRDSTGSIPHTHTQPEGPGPIGGRRALHGVPGSSRACEWPEPYLVTVDTTPRPSSDRGMMPLPSPGLRASGSDTLERTGRPAHPRLAHRQVAFGNP